MRRYLESVSRSRTTWFLTLRVEAPMGRRTLKVHVGPIEYEEAGAPTEGEPLSEEAYRLLFLEADRAECRRRAARIQGISPNSEKNLIQKLTLRGFPLDVAEESVLALVKLGYLKEEDQLARLLEVAEKKYWPKKKALLALMRKGYGREEILEAMERADYRDDRISRLLLEAKLPPCATNEEKDLLLVRRGFRQE